ncbi:AAA family ATPase [Paenibacillus sp. BSR1-1]|uniref:AAA family ATPase n=1 Tax=Paenibacillus sp. BSR1-1 TaxID=3020845 RepID=UPI0025B202FA|nr:AAA family ATPase [Paenibacillus sp. BSR1-1]MDN3019057.1 AAA family ATPase [Paenibacillus sp. BSR1-1]
MELLFAWIDDYKTILKKTSLNFSNEFLFSYNHMKNELTINTNPNYIKDFFKIPNTSDPDLESSFITNLTAIVGENGVGKSTILNFLKERIGGTPFVQEKSEADILVIRTKIGETYSYYVYHADLKEPLITNNTTHTFIPKPYPSSNDVLFSLAPIVKESDYGLVFFSNVLDGNDEVNNDHQINISTNYLTRNMYQKTIFDFNIEEINRQISFIIPFLTDEKNLEYIPFTLPTLIELRWHINENVYKLKLSGEADSLSAFFDSSFKFLEQQVSVKKSRPFMSILAHLHIETIKNKEEIPSNINSDFKFTEEISDFQDIIDNLMILSKIMTDKINPYTTAFLSSFKLLTLINEKKIEKDYLELETTSNELANILDLYKKSIVKHGGFINFKWHKLSSGQMNFLNFYSRVHDKIEEINKLENLIFLIDEGELYLHPQWQKEYVSYVVKFLTYFLKRKHIQVIMTSNSPFIVSDLPQSNIILLRKDNGLTKVVTHLDNYQQTFASNIHNLLTNSFFIKDGLISSFAKQKINEVIRILTTGDKEEIESRRVEIIKTIHLIGEPLIKNKLLQMYNQHNNLNAYSEVSDLKRSIKNLENRIGALEKNDKN